MLSVVKVASYFCCRFSQKFGGKIDEMKLHKLLYLTQRECLVRYDTPIFGEVFEAWKYGPVAPEVRHYYKENLLTEPIAEDELAPFSEAIDRVFECYAPRKSWTLSSITHGEYAWRKAYGNMSAQASGFAIISTDDIRKDASRFRLRQFLRE